MASSSSRVIGNDNPIDTLLNATLTFPQRKHYVEVGEDKTCVSIHYLPLEEGFKNFNVRKDDVYMCGFPKTGTTWACEMSWLIGNNLDYETAKRELISDRFHPLHRMFVMDPEMVKGSPIFPEKYHNFDYINQKQSPRFIRHHFPWSMLPEQIQNGSKTPKMIVTLRAPEDVCLSSFHFFKAAGVYSGTIEEYVELFLAGRVTWGPFWTHVLSYWRQRNNPNLLIVQYAEMKRDLEGVIQKVAKFLTKSLTDDQINKLKDHLSFESMQNNDTINMKMLLPKGKNFVRKGQVGGYKSEMTSEMIERFKQWKKDHFEADDVTFE